MSNIIEQVRHELISNSDETTKESGKRFFKEEVRLLWCKNHDRHEDFQTGI